VIKKLDRKPKQVIIETLIAEVTLTGDFAFGLEYAYRGSSFRSGGGTPIASAAQLGDPVATPTTIPTSTAATALGGLSLFVTNPERFIATLDTLAAEGNLNVVSSPSILTSENKEAEINVVTDVPIPRTTTDPNTDTTTTDFEFREVGVKLKITPKINENGYVTLDIVQELSEIGEIVETTSGNQTSFITRDARTSVVIKDNQTLIIGGLISETGRETLTGIPILNRIPILKRIFGRTVISKDKTELIVMVTPRVVFDEADARAVTDLYNERVQSIQSILKKHKAGRR
ncbi:MAG: hypothetical protein O7B80_00690, partial [bacterium]|nr:hypothetical protein [bacterium]